MRKAIVNCLTGRSWRFKSFDSLTVSTIKRPKKTCKDKMEFIDFQAEVDDSDNDNLEHDFVENNGSKNFVNDSQMEPDTSLNFNRKSHNQSREMHDALK